MSNVPYTFNKKRNVDNVDEGVSNIVEFDITKLPADPGLRIPILDYNANIRDEVRRAYMLKGSCYSLYCYLFRTSSREQVGGESFVGEVFYKQSEQARSAYVTRLNASVDCVRVLLRQEHSFRGHDESEDSLNLVINAVTLGNAPHNCKLTSLDVQKNIVNARAIKTINVIIKNVGDSLFSILVDESRDVSMKEQMSIVLHYVENSGHVNKRFLGIGHVTSTTTLSLKAAIDKVFSRYNLSTSRLRRQGYDGASNMQDVFTMIAEDESYSCDKKSYARNLLESIQKFDFPFNLQLMRSVLGMSNELSKALQRKIKIFECNAIGEIVQTMTPNNERRRVGLLFGRNMFFLSTTLHSYLQLQELNDRFSEVNKELLLCVACLCPQDSFSSFNKKNLIRLAELYPLVFSTVDVIVLNDQFETYIFDMSSDKEFEVLMTSVILRRIATTTVEIVFSAMSIEKDKLRNRMGDQWMNDSTILYAGNTNLCQNKRSYKESLQSWRDKEEDPHIQSDKATCSYTGSVLSDKRNQG
ncbi:uncharacterized protein LOC111387937 [Olea europaea var. sylvestris]|uniref:uncharacterized protein LOC111387937 n=1 Tax=Olea europaea var. sylvestris TaxID=158386 RepID=UPI000C1D852B|nr:uncharacterized protein LOC111387937 [Olea europaea var. sylvestris]